MTAEQALAFVLFAIVAAITPGPSNIILASTGSQVGVVRGLPCLLGVAVGMGFMMFIVAFGLGRLVLESPRSLAALKWCGAGFLLWLSWKIATAGHRDAAATSDVVGFWSAAAFQWVNPKSWLVSASAASTYLLADGASAFVQSAYFGVLFFLAALPACSVWLVFGATTQRLLHTDRAVRTFNVTMGAILAISIGVFIW